MDEFGVLTERYGLKPQGKSAPMLASKGNPVTTSTSSSPSASFFDSAISSSSFESFGAGVDMLSSSSVDYLTSVFSAPTSSSTDRGLFHDGSGIDDIFGSFVSKSRQETPLAPPMDDLLGDLGTYSKFKPPPSIRHGPSNRSDDLLPGFSSSDSTTGKTSSSLSGDPFTVLESTASNFMDPLNEFNIFDQVNNQKPSKKSTSVSLLRPPPGPGQVLKTDTVKSSTVSSIDELEDFAMGGIRNNNGKEPRVRRIVKSGKYNEAEDASKRTKQEIPTNLLNSTGSPRSASAPKSRAMGSDLLFDFDNNIESKAESLHRGPPDSLIGAAFTTGNVGDDLCSMLGDAHIFGSFEDIQGESEERRKARLGRLQRTQDRVTQAVSDMNQRDVKYQLEQEERRRIAEQMDVVIKRWAGGKEGNLRALLSSLHQVVWPECGWEPVSMADIVTSVSVKKVYRKATLCVHPDKVQQRGSTLHEKYIAEKVFDILKEAWNKFNRDER